jgi:predicted chitinase
MDARTLATAMGNALPFARYEQLAPAFNAALLQAQCTTVDRVAMWFSQIGHESGGLRYMEEIWGPTAAQRGYEGRRDLGNTQPGDGSRFRGHGPIQITGRFNHTKVSEWAHANGYVPTPTYFVDNPGELGGDQYGFLGAVWYWTVARDMNSYADRQDLIGATRAVNGGQNGIDDRRVYYWRAHNLGDAILPTPPAPTETDPLMALNEAEQRTILEGAGQLQAFAPDPANGRTGLRQVVQRQFYNVKDATKDGWPWAMWADVWNEVVWDGYPNSVDEYDKVPAEKVRRASLVSYVLGIYRDVALLRRELAELRKIVEAKA